VATLVHTDRSTQEIEDIHRLSYGQLRKLVDGPVEYVYFEDGRVLFVNEEFTFRDFPLNLLATTIIDGHHGKIHGPAYSCRPTNSGRRKNKRAGSSPMTDESFIRDMTAGPNDGVIYNYGMTMFLIQVLEHQLVNLIVASNLPRRDQIPRDELLEIRANAFRQTMGTQLKGLAARVEIPPYLKEKLNRIVAKRNHLAHSFFREHHGDMLSSSGSEALIRDLFDLQRFVVAVDDELTLLERSIWRESGMEYPF
jgi:hypothetical protein